MRLLGTDTPLYLLEPNDLQVESLPADIAPYRVLAEQVLIWARTYLCQPHGGLGRDGVICPYVEQSLCRALFWMAVYSHAHPTIDDVVAMMRKYRDWLLELEPMTPVEAQYKAIVVLFPNVVSAMVHDVIDGTQILLKPEFVTRGLMIGQFHAECNEPGLWNQEFRPLRSPVPLLAIRYMVRWDAPFLMRDPWSLSAYLRRFGGDIPPRFRAQVCEAAAALGVEHGDRTR